MRSEGGLSANKCRQVWFAVALRRGPGSTVVGASSGAERGGELAASQRQ